MSKAYLIDSAALTVTETEYSGLAELQKLVGGYLEAAYQWADTGDVLYVDEEGQARDVNWFFSVRAVRPDQPFAGNGVLVGREIDEQGTTAAPSMTLDELRALVCWVP